MLQQIKQVHSTRFSQTEAAAVSAFREEQLKKLLSDELPQRKHESWRYIPRAALSEQNINTSLLSAPLPRLEQVETYRIKGALIVAFVDGKYVRELSDTIPEDQLSVMSLLEVLKSNPNKVLDFIGSTPIPSRVDHQLIQNLSAAFLQEGLFVEIKKSNTQISMPLQILNFLSGEASLSVLNVFIKCAPLSELTVLETTVAEKGGFVTGRVFGVCEPGSLLNYYRYNNCQSDALNLMVSDFSLMRDSKLNHINLASGGKVNRHQLNVYMLEEGAAANLNGFSLLRNQEIIDNQLNVEHKAPRAVSRQHYKSILLDKAKSINSGRVHIYEGATGTDSDQLNKSIVLSRQAEVDTKPQLEVFADDVKATHGAAIGRLDIDELFYLESRGIPRQEALAMLAYAFVDDVLLNVKSFEVRSFLREKIMKEFSSLKVEALYGF